MKIKFFRLLSIIILFLIFVIFYKGLQKPNIYTPNIGIKKFIPSFEAKMFDTNEKINSKEIFKNDNFYLVNIWASWCLPCLDEHQFLVNLSLEENIKIIGLNYKDKKKNAKIFLNKNDNPYDLILSDVDGTIAIEWGAFGVPETFLIYNKKVIKKIIGPINENSFQELKKIIQ